MERYINIIEDYSLILTKLTVKHCNDLQSEFPLFFLQKNILNIYSLEKLLEGYPVSDGKVYDLNSIATIIRSFFETSVVFYSIFYNTVDKKQVDLKLDLWKLTYYNSSDEKFRSINVFNKYDIEELKNKIKANKANIPIEDEKILKKKNTELFIIKDGNIKIENISNIAAKFMNEFQEGTAYDKFYRNFSEQSHTSYKTIHYFVVNPPHEDVKIALSNNLIHFYYIIDSFLKCFLKTTNITFDEESIDMYNDMVTKIDLLAKSR